MKRLSSTKKGWFLIVWMMVVSVTIFAATREEQIQNIKSQAEQQTHEHQKAMKEHVEKMEDTMKEHHKAEMMQECNIAGRSGYLQSTDDILGQNVNNCQGQKLGSVEELIMNNSRQTIDYVVISANDKLYPVPWKAFEPGTEAYTLDISIVSLNQAPTISSLDSSQFEDSALREKSHEYYQRQITAAQEKSMGRRTADWAREKTPELFRDQSAGMMYSANQIIGYEVRNKQDKDLGELKDIVFDVREGNLAYGLVSFGGVMGIASKTAAVPWESIQLESTREIAQLDTDESSLRNAVLPGGDIQQLSEPVFARQIHQNFNQEPYWEVFGFVAPVGAREMSMVPWQAGSTFNQNFNPDTVETIQGSIRQIGSFTPAKDAAEGLRLKIKTAEGRTMTVYAGPRDYYMQQSMRFSKGDQVTITGSRTTVDNKNVILAGRIQKGDSTLRLRDSQGTPLWGTGSIQQPMQQQKDEATEMKKDTTSPRYY